MDVRIRAITSSAFRHGISSERIHEAIKSCREELGVPKHGGGDIDLVLYLGRDQNGVPLEVVAREHDDGSITVFHAMRMRPAYRKLLASMSGLS